jgi:hypothetical protein
VNFLFDNNLSHPLARALRLLSQPVTHVRDIEGLGPAAPDDLILNYAARRGYHVVTKDRQILRTPTFRAIITEEGVGVFFLYTGRARQLRAWEEAKLVVKAWDNVVHFAARNSPPFTASIQRNGQVRAIR